MGNQKPEKNKSMSYSDVKHRGYSASIYKKIKRSTMKNVSKYLKTKKCFQWPKAEFACVGKAETHPHTYKNSNSIHQTHVIIQFICLLWSSWQQSIVQWLIKKKRQTAAYTKVLSVYDAEGTPDINSSFGFPCMLGKTKVIIAFKMHIVYHYGILKLCCKNVEQAKWLHYYY